MTTESPVSLAPAHAVSAVPATAKRPAKRSSGRGAGVTIAALIAVAAFMAVLALLAIQLRSNPRSLGLVTQRPRIVVVRRIYQTTVHERIIGASTGGGGTTVSSSVAAPVAPAAPAATPVTTHTS